MRTMKDKERFFLIVKVFLDLKGPSTARDIAEYIKRCPVKMQKDFTAPQIGVLLRGQTWIYKEREKPGANLKYQVKT